MWPTLDIVTLLSLLAALGCCAVAARRLDARLGAMIEDQTKRRRSNEVDLASARARLEELLTGGPGC
jgi:hypothetical protein